MKHHFFILCEKPISGFKNIVYDKLISTLRPNFKRDKTDTFSQVLSKFDRWCPMHDGWTDGPRPIYCPTHDLFIKDSKHWRGLIAEQWRCYKPPLTLSHSLIYLPNTVCPLQYKEFKLEYENVQTDRVAFDPAEGYYATEVNAGIFLSLQVHAWK